MRAKELTYGIIGLGNIGKAHVELFQKKLINNAKLIAVCSRTAPAELSSLIHGNDITFYNDYRSLINQSPCDVVLVATPTLSHREVGVAVLKAGKHLLMEKPVAMTISQADEVTQVARQEKRQCGVFLNQRFDPAYSKIKQLLDQNTLGKIQRLSWILTHWYRPDIYYNVSDWRGTWIGEGGGLLVNQCIHNLDIINWWFGTPTDLWAQCGWGKYHDIEVEDEVSAILNFDDNISGCFISSTGEAPGINQLDIIGDQASLSYDGETLLLKSLSVNRAIHCAETDEMFSVPDHEETAIPIPDAVNQHQRLIQEFTDAVLNDIDNPFGAETASGSLEIANAMLLSAWTKSSVELPLDRQAFAEQFDKRLKSSNLREKSAVQAKIDMNSSYR